MTCQTVYDYPEGSSGDDSDYEANVEALFEMFRPKKTLLVKNAGDDFSVLDCPEFRRFSRVTMIDPRDGKKFVQQIIKKMTRLSQTCKISQEIVGGKTVCIIFTTDSKTICYKPGKVDVPDKFTTVYKMKTFTHFCV